MYAEQKGAETRNRSWRGKKNYLIRDTGKLPFSDRMFDSYNWKNEKGVKGFPGLLEEVALINPLLRVRFSTSHPKDISDELLYTMERHKNICKHIHLPAQSGSSRILKLMNREYTREMVYDRIKAIHAIIPECSISTDMITGFCAETPEDHKSHYR